MSEKETKAVIASYLRHCVTAKHPIEDQLRATVTRQNQRFTELANLLNCHVEDVLSAVQHVQRQRDEFFAALKEKGKEETA